MNVQKYCWLLANHNIHVKVMLVMPFPLLKKIILCWTVILRRNQPLTAAALLKGGADGNRLNKNKCSPLHVAVNKGYKEVVKTFLNSSCNVNAQVCTCILHIFVYVWCFSIRLNKIKWIRNICTFVDLVICLCSFISSCYLVNEDGSSVLSFIVCKMCF